MPNTEKKPTQKEKHSQCESELVVQKGQLQDAKDAYNKQVAYEAAHPIKAFFSSIIYSDSKDLARVVDQEAQDVLDKKMECGARGVIADPGKALKRLLRGGRD